MLEANIQITTVQNDQEILEILELQKANLPVNLSKEEIESQGFVTVIHNYEQLKEMNGFEKSVIAKSEGKVVGYCMAMNKEMGESIEVLKPLFNLLNKLTYQDKPLQDFKAIYVGQACIAADFRGRGLLDKMYEKYKECFQNKYDLVLTEIALRNQRSLKAHQRIGFKIIHEYTAPNEEVWAVMVWDWS
ncbi:MAG: GNAT family N-acetyltransferase [Candidatus Caenarcaniphilales bacterium]|nr:GNAT family N-acetyltransferase [Candidatus Caenarcaniphilales bacterium]